MTIASIVTICLFASGILFQLISFIVQNTFIKKIDKLNDVIEKMADKFDQYVKVQDHREDVGELKRRIEKLEEKGHAS